MAENDLFEITKKNLFTPNDYRAQVPKEFAFNKRYHLSDYAVNRSETYSFIVDWELPTDKNLFDKEGRV